MKKTQKPPIGIMPKFIHDEHRILELKEAIVRHLQANWPIPQEFVQEYNQLTETLEME